MRATAPEMLAIPGILPVRQPQHEHADRIPSRANLVVNRRILEIKRCSGFEDFDPFGAAGSAVVEKLFRTAILKKHGAAIAPIRIGECDQALFEPAAVAFEVAGQHHLAAFERGGMSGGVEQERVAALEPDDVAKPLRQFAGELVEHPDQRNAFAAIMKVAGGDLKREGFRKLYFDRELSGIAQIGEDIRIAALDIDPPSP